MGFTKVLGLAVSPYSVSIMDFLNSWPINYDPWSYVISIFLGYPLNHIISTKFAIDVALLLSYCVISNRPVTVPIMVTGLGLSFLSFPLFLLHRGLLHIHKVCSVLFTNTPLLVVYHLLFDRFCALESVTTSYSFLDSVYYSGRVQTLVIYRIHSIFSWMKEIRIVPI